MENIKTYIDVWLIVSNDFEEDHFNKLNRVKVAGFTVNAKNSFFSRNELEYWVFKITRQGIIPWPDKVEAIKNIAVTKTKKQQRKVS